MPWDKNSLGLEGLLSLDDGLGPHLSVVGNLSIHIVDEEWLREVVLIVGVWHSLELKGHHGSGINVSEFVHTSGGVGVGVEELGGGCFVLGEIWVGSALIPLLIVVDHVV